MIGERDRGCANLHTAKNKWNIVAEPLKTLGLSAETPLHSFIRVFSEIVLVLVTASNESNFDSAYNSDQMESLAVLACRSCI